MTKFEKNAVVIALWACIGQLINLLLFFLYPGRDSVWYYVTVTHISEYSASLDKYYPGWKIIHVFAVMYIWLLPIMLIVINNDKFSRRNNSII